MRAADGHSHRRPSQSVGLTARRHRLAHFSGRRRQLLPKTFGQNSFYCLLIAVAQCCWNKRWIGDIAWCGDTLRGVQWRSAIPLEGAGRRTGKGLFLFAKLLWRLQMHRSLANSYTWIEREQVSWRINLASSVSRDPPLIAWQASSFSEAMPVSLSASRASFFLLLLPLLLWQLASERKSTCNIAWLLFSFLSLFFLKTQLPSPSRRLLAMLLAQLNINTSVRQNRTNSSALVVPGAKFSLSLFLLLLGTFCLCRE